MLNVSSKHLAVAALVLSAIGFSFFRQRIVAADLQAEARELSINERQLKGLRAEHAQLAAALQAAKDLAMQVKRSPYSSSPDASLSAISPGAPAQTTLASSSAAPRPQPLFSPRRLSVAGMKSVSEWANVGMGTPQAALETQSWAFQHGDSLSAAQTLILDDDARGKVETFLESLPPAERAKYVSAEQVAALLLGAFSRDFAGIRFAPPVVNGPDDVILWTLWTYQDGHSREHDVHLRRSAHGWQRVISDPEGFIANALASLEPKAR